MAGEYKSLSPATLHSLGAATHLLMSTLSFLSNELSVHSRILKAI
jgi:hypothetical protein